MPDLRTRSFAAEWMDDPAVDEATFAACLIDLAAVNGWTLARPPTLRWLAQATRDWPRARRFTLVDVGYGQGDMLRHIHRWATRRGLVPELIGVDLSPWSETSAREATPAEMAIDYRTGDVFEVAFDRPVDFVISSLVAHHLDDDQLIAFLRWMEATAAKGWFVNDLHRHAIAYHGFRALSSVMRWHPFVRHDGPLSVARAFRRDDWERLIAGAGLDRATIELRWHVPFRLCVGRLR
ncbi:methyltransferase domain-containing protein [Sphingoaurantiacus capsulatus]|uniref:Methyltransferase domain-containing protein n=1 Tax=Sphingoaurantiacus capsulatus TaxID=1771310 RepID=A0ABV7XE93_9SPHN